MKALLHGHRQLMIDSVYFTSASVWLMYVEDNLSDGWYLVFKLWNIIQVSVGIVKPEVLNFSTQLEPDLL